MRAEHQNMNHAAAYEPRISQKHLLKSFAQKALAKVPGSQQVIDKYFKTDLIRPELTPPKPIDLVMHHGLDAATR